MCVGKNEGRSLSPTPARPTDQITQDLSHLVLCISKDEGSSTLPAKLHHLFAALTVKKNS